MSRFDLAQFSGHPFFLHKGGFRTLTQPWATAKQKANGEPQISSSCPRWENKWLFSWATLPHSHLPPLLHLFIPRSCRFFITGLLSSRACSLLLGLARLSLSIFLSPSSVYWLWFDSYLGQPCEPLDPANPSASPGGGHQPSGAICLHVMEVWRCGARLDPSRPSGEGQLRQMPKHSRVCVCVC